MKTKNVVTTATFIAVAALIFFIISQTYPAGEEIFITNSYAITPKSQPHLFILMWFITVALIVFGVYVGKIIAFYLLRKNVAGEIIGVFSLIATVVLGYQWLIVGEDVKTTKDFIIAFSILLLFGLSGLFFTFIKLIQKFYKRKK